MEIWHERHDTPCLTTPSVVATLATPSQTAYQTYQPCRGIIQVHVQPPIGFATMGRQKTRPVLQLTCEMNPMKSGDMRRKRARVNDPGGFHRSRAIEMAPNAGSTYGQPTKKDT
eukprot:s38_g19.t1